VFTGVIRKQRIEEVDSRQLKAESENREIEGKARVVFCAWFSTRAEYHVRWSKVRSNDRDTDANCRCSVIYSLEKKFWRDDSNERWLKYGFGGETNKNAGTMPALPATADAFVISAQTGVSVPQGVAWLNSAPGRPVSTAFPH
jgi:hypothetical protein